MSRTTMAAAPPGILQQPRAVWAVTFAAIVAFMGIGLVDPILLPISEQFHASPSQVTLLFSSYMAVMGLAMLITSAVSSRIGQRTTLLTGLVLIAFSAGAAGMSDSVNQIIGFRAGWGLGNALFIATALAVIVGAASGGISKAIILYEAAIGIGIASGPLLGGELGHLSWRGPFFGVAALMAIAFLLLIVMLPGTEKPTRRTSITDPLRALRHRGLLTMAITALLYNFGFFTLLAYAPFPLAAGARQIGLIFFGWGLCVGISSIFLAPVLQRWLGTIPVTLLVLTIFALDLVVMAVFTEKKAVLVTCVIAAGVFLGVNNTLVTEAVMLAAPVERATASAAYSFVRFGGGAVAPWLAGKLGETYGEHVPFWMGAGATLLGVLVLAAGRRWLTAVSGGRPAAHGEPETQAVTVSE